MIAFHNPAHFSFYIGPLLMVPSVWAIPEAPEKFPPTAVAPEVYYAPASSDDEHYAPLALSEWTYHKSVDGSRPSGVEQQYVWLMNRARANPEVEGIWLSLVQDSGIKNAVSYFSVNLDILRNEFAALSPNPPGAFDIRLHEAAVAHSEYLISIDGQNHNDQFARVTNAGFSYSSARGSVYSYSRNGPYGHAGFNIDWGGSDGTGMQTGRGHRAGIMGSYANVGVGIVAENNSATSVGPQVTTINYCNAQSSKANHYNRFIVGTVWEDANDNRLYDPGEGLSGVSVTPDSGNFYAVTGDAGGYAIPVDPGIYEVTFSGGSLVQSVVKTVTVGSTSVLVPWVDFSSESMLDGASLVVDTTTFQTDASWVSVFGQPSTVLVSDDLENWEIIDSGIVNSGDSLSWSEDWAGASRRFWTIRAWNFLEE